MLLFHGYRWPGCGRSAANCPGVNASELTSSTPSSAVFSDFLLNLVFAGSALETAPCAKRDAMDESRTAIALVNFPGFILCCVKAAQTDGIRPITCSCTRTRMRVSLWQSQCA